MDLLLELKKQEIAKLFRSGHIGEDFQKRLNGILLSIYDDGREMGLTESLNYVSNEADRERLFEVIDNFQESKNNSK